MVAGHTDRSVTRAGRPRCPLRAGPGYRRDMTPDELPPELRGVSPDPIRESTTPAWVRLTALLLVVALVGYFVIAAF